VSWRYKLYSIEPAQVVTIDPINENFQPFVEELTSGLNEHNLAVDAFTGHSSSPRGAFTDDAVFILHLSQADAVEIGLAGYTSASSANWVSIAGTGTWEAFDKTGLRKSFTSRGGTTYLCASFNIHCGKNRTHDSVPTDDYPTGTPDYRQLGFGYLVALRLNGTVLNETILGSGDAGEDDFRSHRMTAHVTEVEDYVKKDPLGRFPQGGGGLSAARLPVTVDAVVELLPGENLVEVVVLNIKSSMQTFTGQTTYIGQRELYVLEMVR